MANIVFCNIVFYGNGIEKLNEVVQYHDRITPYELCQALGIEDDEYDGRYYLSDFELKGNELWCNAEFAWNVNIELLNIIAKSIDVDWSCFGDYDDGKEVWNDDEKKFFTTEWILDAEDSPIGDYKEFDSEEEVVAFLKKKTGMEMSAGEWSAYFYDEEFDDWCEEVGYGIGYARLWEVERV